MKALVGAFYQEKALVGAFSVIVKTDNEYIHCSVPTVASADQGQSGQGGGEVGAHIRDPRPDQLQGIDQRPTIGGDSLVSSSLQCCS